MEAGDWERLDEVVAHTQAYLQKVQTNQIMGQTVQAIKNRESAITTICVG
jgi:hypothetical protein